ncbi:DUF72 domain-containing protein [Candidatus Nitrosotenuis cloacae]|uniref:DUF72 domain-containing protein n=1 Tax=Candidatus Nitrosotenuis cloacae TaxID=1603555 RepID=UPI00227F9EB3|nr:DUF72 domain-containing protein [Candidatus Nitrosotenuis cloacae]
MEISIGCTGWSYGGWVGPFYPQGMAPDKFLRFYSSFFDLTEVNSTFYRIPSENVAKKWASDTPPHFRFTSKLPQMITHESRLQKLHPFMEQYASSMNGLGQKHFLTVVQLPPSLSFDEALPHLDELNSFLSNYVIEGRHASWFEDRAVRYLTDKNTCLVWNDVAGVNNTLPVTSDLVYLRIIGDRTIPDEDFGTIVRDRTTDLKSWVERLYRIQDRIKFAVILANNHYEGFGAATANKLRAIFGMEDVWHSKKQRTLAEF